MINNQARINMIEGQIMPSDVINPRIISAFYAVPREIFMPDNMHDAAYIDDFVQLDERHFMLPPVTTAKLLDKANIQPQDKVLVIDCANGYTLALVAHLADDVTGLESSITLAEQAQANIAALNLNNVKITTGDLQLGCREYAPYNKILILGKIADAPDNLALQLVQGGQVITITGDSNNSLGYITVYNKYDDKLGGVQYEQVIARELKEFSKSKDFVF